MMDDIRVRVMSPGGDYMDPLAMGYKFYVFTKSPLRLLGQDGVWRPFDEGGYPNRPTLELPAEAMDALYAELTKVLGKDKPVESTVLREWLAVERNRVDDILHAGRG